MPTYQYACTECDNAFEQVQSFSDDALTECPQCEGRLRKLFNAVGVVFKGSGFYRTDSRAKNGSSAGSTSDTKADGKSDGKSDSKSDAKSETASGSKSESASSSESSASSSSATSSKAPATISS